jgi:peptidyl-prolyl cis-trans isomerase SurA
MKKCFATGLLVLILGYGSYAQKKQNVLLTIGKEQVTLDDFLRVYERNNSNIQDSINKKTAVEYLELYTNFKLKVLEAKNAGMDTTAAFRKELAGYRTELAAPYLTDNKFDESLVKETYRRMLKEINASHIMISLSENAAPEDTMKVYARISDIREQIVKGLDFNEAARQYSEDPSAKTNGGDLGWFTVFQMVYPFETAAYSTPLGQISQPFRTRFGYHIIKVNDIRNAEGEIHVAHIMKMYPQNATDEQKAGARNKIDSLYLLIQGGADFATVARENSDEQRSAEKGGEMPWFNKLRMIPEFSNPSFELKNNGDVSKPIDSGFGFHIIKRLELKPVPSYEEAKRELEDRLRNEKERNTQSHEAFVSKLKSEYNFTASQPAIDEILKTSLASLRKEKPEIPAFQGENKTLFSFANSSFTTRNWKDYISKTDSISLPRDSTRLVEFFKSWENESLLAYEDAHLEEKYPEFRSLMEEYHDGMLLFDISEKKIWQRASTDTTGLEKFYEINKQKYLWPDRFRGMIVQCYNPEIRDQVEKYLETGIPISEMNDIMKLAPGNIQTTEGSWAKNDNPTVDYYIWNGPRPSDWNNRTGFVWGKMVPPEPKLLNEARGYHIADYQQYLEDQWISELRAKYRVKVNKKLLKTLTHD